MAEICTDGVWDVSGCARTCEELPISATLVERIRAWQEWHDREDDIAWREPIGVGMDEKLFFWEQHPGKPVASFNAEGRAIARALKAELPSDWIVICCDLDGWLPGNPQPWLVLRD
jgi:hypothetical protein